MLIGIPLKDFAEAKTRLGISSEGRIAVVQAVAGRVLEECLAAGHRTAVVATGADVTGWAAERGAETLPDPGTGLNGAASAIVSAAAGDTWCVVHGDLPLVSARDLEGVASTAEGAIVLAPARDGGTNLIAGHGRFGFRFGPGSFAGHLAAAAGRAVTVVVRTGLSLDLDTPRDLAIALEHPGGEWLRPFLSSAP